VVVYNGEIYNHLDLRREIEADGAAAGWRGHSDTETLLAGVAHWGLDETLRRSLGMFALALWDQRDRRLFLARDRMGEKPLYWGWAGRALVFGSELKALRAHPDIDQTICRGAVAQFLQFAYVPAPRSIHPGIYKLEPATILEVGEMPPAPPAAPLRPGDRNEDLSIRRYWSLNAGIEAGARDPITDDGEAVAALEQTLSRAVSRQMISDVPLGAFLSGGVDSSTIVALVQAQSTRPVKTFTVGFEEAGFDESPYAAAVAGHLGTDHVALRVTNAETRAVIPDLPTLYDEPFADSSQIPTHLVCRAARTQATVALSGDGGDELFGGYNRHVWGPRIWNRVASVPHPVRRGLGRAIEAVPVSAWDAVGAMHRRVRRGAGGFVRLGDKAHQIAGPLRSARTVDDFYRSLVTEWPVEMGLVPGLDAEPACRLEDPLPGTGVENPAMRMMVQDTRSYLPDDIL